MYTAGQKDPDFILRPSGEHRLSNFYAVAGVLCGICGYGRVMAGFCGRIWVRAIEEYNTRNRRFGGI